MLASSTADDLIKYFLLNKLRKGILCKIVHIASKLHTYRLRTSLHELSGIMFSSVWYPTIPAQQNATFFSILWSTHLCCPVFEDALEFAFNFFIGKMSGDTDKAKISDNQVLL